MSLLMTVIMLISLGISEPSYSAEKLEFQPGGVVLYGARSYSGAVIAAYQKPYAMNFAIWKPQDLPAGWYATFDGFPVAQIAENRWVYGQIGTDGAITPTNILVGSVIPSNVPGIARIASLWNWGKSIDTPKFRWIRTVNINRLGWLKTETVNTIIAWNTHQPGVYIWLGNKWKKYTPRTGEYTWQMIKRISPQIAKILRKYQVSLESGEPVEVADLTRQWGLIWGGRVVLESLKTFGRDTGRDSPSETTTSFGSDSSGGSSNEAPSDGGRDNGGQWDVD